MVLPNTISHFCEKINHFLKYFSTLRFFLCFLRFPLLLLTPTKTKQEVSAKLSELTQEIPPRESPSMPQIDFTPTRTYSSPDEFSGTRTTLSGTHILVDAYRFNEDSFRGTTIRVPSLTQTVRFRGGGQTFEELNIEVLGDTVVIFENFSYVGGASGSALSFTGANPSFVSIGAENSISGRGNFDSVSAAGNLSILGNADFTVDHVTPETVVRTEMTPQNIRQRRSTITADRFNGSSTNGWGGFRYGLLAELLT
jgi:hypothetical protein